ncbi:hypothetical protein V6N13_092404 [Hibiscus sabdariffa]
MENPNPTVDGLQLHSTTISGRPPDEGLLPDRCLPPAGDSLLTLEHTDSGSELRDRTAKDSSMAICSAKFPCTTLEGQATNSDKEHSAGGDQFVFPPVMERPASPTPLESQRVVKRGKIDGFPNGHMAHVSDLESSVTLMETEDECGMAGKESVGNCNASYAAAVQGTSNMGAGNSRGLLGEDILGVHNAGTEVNNEKVTDSSKDSAPFGPWMVASHKNRRPRKEIGKRRDDGGEHGPSKSSKFHVLQDLDEEIDLEQRVEVLDSARLEGKRPTSHVKDKQPINALSEPRHSSAPFHVVV